MPVKLYSQMEVDPLRDDLAVKLVELRSSVKTENPKIAGGLKVAANSAAFGILCQLECQVFGFAFSVACFFRREDLSHLPDEIWEEPGGILLPRDRVTRDRWVAFALRDVGAHCARHGRSDRGHGHGQRNDRLNPRWWFGSMRGRPTQAQRLRSAERKCRHPGAALSLRWISIRDRFESLNPWRRCAQNSIPEVEKENFDCEWRAPATVLYCFSAKLYCLFNLDGNKVLVRKPSGHGLGFLLAPYTIADWQRRTGRKWKEDLPPWIFEAWHLILSRELGLPHKPPTWLKQPAVMTVPITTPQVLGAARRFQR